MMKTKTNASNVLSIISIVLVILSHIGVLAAAILLFRYYNIYPSIFISAIVIIAIILLIVDIIFFFGHKFKDIALKIVVIVLSTFILIGSTVGVYYVREINSAVDGIVDGGTSTTQEVKGVFISYNQKFKTLDELSGKSIGFLNETTEGLTSIAMKTLDDKKIDYGEVFYNSYVEMYQALVDKSIDVVAMPEGYRSLFERDENLNYSADLEKTNDLFPFSGTVNVEGRKNNKKLDSEPFNVLLIGYSRTEIGSSIGLADAIIVATINPQTYTISMLSIARDSFVPISCYGGAYDKINSGRGTSRACFIETVENFIGKEIDFYMEADYEAIVNIVEAIDGIYIYNPVAFELDGIYVPEGYFQASGWEALEFCRERHHMPNGDFDRQQHQKEVILAIAKKFIESRDVSLALNAMKAASEDLSTDLSVHQLTQIFNAILNTKNYTGLSTFDLIDFHALRMTGYGGIMYYSYSMMLPLWVYLIYQGSYDESIRHIDEVLGNFSTINQDNTFEFSSQEPYVREPFYSESYPNNFMYQPDPMPPYWADLTGMSVGDAMQWASSNGVTLTVKNILPGSAEYKSELEGQIIEQSVRYGNLCSKYPSGTITVMGTGEVDESKQVPNFVGKAYSKFTEWANKYGVRYNITFDTTVEGEVGTVVSQSSPAFTPIDSLTDGVSVVVKATFYDVKFDKNGMGLDSDVPATIKVKTGDSAIALSPMNTVTEDDGDKWYFTGWFTDKTGGTQVYDTSSVSDNITLYAHWTFECNHTFGDWVTTAEATCDKEGSREHTCTKCGEKVSEAIPALGHQWGEWIVDTPAAVGVEGSQHHVCSVCGSQESQTIPALPAEETAP